MAKWPYCTSKWQRLRLAKLAESPVCVVCELRGMTELADTVDHVKPISQGGDAFPDLPGLMSLCASCHSEKTASFDRTMGNASGRRFKGCDQHGNPIDPADGWWGGESRALVVRCLAPMARRVEQAMNAALLTAEGRKRYFVEHDLAGLLRGDQKARFEAYRIGREWGWLSPNEIRRLENMSEIADGDEYLSPLNMTVLGQRNSGQGGGDG